MVFTASLAVSALFLWLTFRKTDLAAVLASAESVNLGVLGLSLVTKLLGFGFMTLRSRVLVRDVGEIGYGDLFRSIWIGFTGNTVLPFRAGELLRIDYLSRCSGVDWTAFVAVVAMERLLDSLLLMLLFGATVTLFLVDVPLTGSLLMFAAVVVGAFAVTLFVARRPDWFIGIVETVSFLLGARLGGLVEGKARSFAQGLSGLGSWRGVILASGATVGYWATSLASVQIWLWAFSLDTPWYAPAAIIVFAGLGTLLPSSPGFVGTYHYFVSTALQQFGVGSVTAASVATVGHAVAFGPFAVVGILLVLVQILTGSYPRHADGKAAVSRSSPDRDST